MNPSDAPAKTRPAEWAVQDGVLRLVIDGSPELPRAEEVFSLVFDGATSFRGASITLDPVRELTFSRYPARLMLEINHDPARPDGGLFTALTAAGRGGAVTIDLEQLRGADHTMIAGQWYPFVPGAVAAIDTALAAAGVSQTGELSLRQYLELRRLASTEGPVVDRTAGRRIRPQVEVPRAERELISFNANLYPYQRAGWHWLTYIWQEGLGAILADEMGLGKTLQVIALLASPERDMAAPSMVVAPATLLENWRREIQRFAPGLRTTVHQGPMRTGNYRELAPYDVIITSYDAVVSDSSMFHMIDWRIVVLDEAQAIKNPETRRSKAVRQLRRRTGIAVTGTPLENRLRDLWSLADFAIPGLLGDLADFESRFDDDHGGATAVEPLVSPIMLRRMVSEVATDLPPRIDIPEALSLADDEAAAYEAVREATIREFASGAVLVALTRLRMFCAHPMLLDETDWPLDRCLGFSKLARLFELLDEIFARRQKALVFTSYNRVGALIARVVRQRYGFLGDTINGDTPVSERQQRVDEFTAEAGPAVLALNPRAAGAGLNITAATHVIHYNLEWNPAVEDQASARAHRRGQDRPVTIHRLYFANTVEQVVDERLARKRELSRTAVVGVEGSEEDRVEIARALQMSPVART